MKKILMSVLLGLALSSAGPIALAKEPVKAAATPVTKEAPIAKEVVGVWVSKERTPVIAPGTMTLRANGTVTLAPEGFDPLEGTFKTDGQFIDITTSRGKASLIYTLNKDSLRIEYENGTVQNFTKSQATPQKKAKK